jgi:hypothetical protein
MKNNLFRNTKIVTLGLILSLSSCSKEIIEDDQVINPKSFELSLKYENIVIGQTTNNNFDYYVNNKVDHKIIFKQNLSKSRDSQYTITIIDSENIRITNPNNTSEYYDLKNVNQSEGEITFDIQTSEGKNLSNVEIYTTAVQAKCPACWLIPIAGIVEAVIDAMTDSDCVEAINTCVEAGGLPSTEIEEGFFSNTCKVTCAEKQNS